MIVQFYNLFTAETFPFVYGDTVVVYTAQQDRFWVLNNCQTHARAYNYVRDLLKTSPCHPFLSEPSSKPVPHVFTKAFSNYADALAWAKASLHRHEQIIGYRA